MTEMGSTSRSTESPPLPAEAGRIARGDLAPNANGVQGPPNGRRSDDHFRAAADPAASVSEAMSDSAARILQGRILPGDRLGHFDLLQYVGGGGMGRVFRARTPAWPAPSP